MNRRPSPSDVEANLPASKNPFDEGNVRIRFIRKVYAILTVQLMVTTGIIAAFMFVPQLNTFAKQNGFAMMLASIAACVLLVAVLCCCRDLLRSFPLNFIILAAFTVLMAISLSGICIHYKTDEVLMAAGITTVVFLALTIFAMQTAIDFTVCTGFACILLVILMILGIVAAIFPSKILSLIYAGSGAAIFSFYILIDTQLITGGAFGKQRAVTLSPEDYILGALELYMDVINLFLYILELVRQLKDE